MAGKFGRLGLKALFVSCPFIIRVAEALDHEITNEDFHGCSRDDKPVSDCQCSLRKSTSKAQVFKTVEFSIDFLQRS